MPVIEFGEWLPDLPALGNPGVTLATNVVPNAQGYAPQGDFSALTDALDARARGAFQGIDNDLNVFQYAGDSGKLYQNVNNSWTDRSKSGGYALGTEEKWEFVQWNNKVIATHIDDNPQQLTFGGTTFSDLTTAFQARHIAVIRDFVVVGNTNDSTDGKVPDRVRWSAIDDETDWTVSAATLSDYQDLEIGAVQQIVGGEFGLVFMQDTVWRMTFVGTPTVFQFDEIAPGVGCIGPNAAVNIGNVCYVWSERGFYAIDNGNTTRPIGANKIDDFAINDLDDDYLDRIYTAVDKRRVYWAYPGSGNSNGNPNKVLVYDFTLDRWSVLEKDVDMIWSSSGTGQTLEQLDNINTSIDALSFSLDSSAWKGGRLTTLAAFDTNQKHGFFDGSNMTGTIRTKEFELVPGRQAHLKSFSHVVAGGGSVTAKVRTRDNLLDSQGVSNSLTERTSNRFTYRKSARYHQFEFSLSGAYEHAIGMQIDPGDIAQGGRRGR